jgi:hypothetical protein
VTINMEDFLNTAAMLSKLWFVSGGRR